jgi:hypothetical protein
MLEQNCNPQFHNPVKRLNKVKSYLTTWHVIPHHINLGPCIPMS